MYEQSDSFLYKLRYLFVAVLVVGNIFLISLLLSTIGAPSTPATSQTQGVSQTTTNRPTNLYDDPNVVTGGMSKMADELGRAAGSTGQVMNDVFHSAAATAAKGGRLAMQGGKFAANIARSGTMAVLHRTVNSVVFVARIPGNIFGLISGTGVVRAAIQPADRTPVPIIDPYKSTMLASAATAAPAQPVSQPATHNDTAVAWPIHGDVTTLFGVPHWPYQPTHTGLDISSGHRSGVTPIKPFRSGRVVEAIRSNYGLGNYVTVDHGGGLTSVYAHLYSIAVQVGQTVDKNTALGTEGSTGASTGTHLHFEIRQNGQPVDPRRYVSGQP